MRTARWLALLLLAVGGAGTSSLSWDGRDGSGRPVAAGAYFLRVDVAGEVTVRKGVVTR